MGQSTQADGTTLTTTAPRPYIKGALARGWILTPLVGKRPTRPGWQAEPPLDAETLLQHPGNLGLVCGRHSGIYVIDVDAAKGGQVPEGLPETVTVETGGGGLHLYFAYPPDVTADVVLGNTSGRLGAHVDTRGDGGQVVYPGSVHPDTGAVYEWAAGLSPDDIDPVPLPQWVVDMLTTPKQAVASTPTQPLPVRHPAAPSEAYVLTALSKALERIKSTPEGQRNHTLNIEAYSLGGLIYTGIITEDELVTELHLVATEAGLKGSEIAATIRSGLRAGQAKPRALPPPRERKPRPAQPPEPEPPLAESAAPQPAAQATPEKHDGQNIIPFPEPLRLAEHFIQRYHFRQELELRRAKGDWFRYIGPAYEVEDAEKIRARVYNHLDKLWVPKIDKNTGEEKLQKIQPDNRLVTKVLDAMPACGPLVDAEIPAWLDGEVKHRPPATELVSCTNGLLHIPDRELHPHSPRFFSVTTLPFAYDPDASAPIEWQRFLTTLWGEDTHAKRTLQEWFGYCLTPDTRQQKMLMLVGPKRSGKGTIARILTALLGKENVCSPTLGSLASHFGVQTLLYKNLAIIGDARLSGRTDSAAVTERLLSISGEDLQSVPRKHRTDWVGYLPARFMLLTNELPRLTDASGALASRFIILPLDKSFIGEEDYYLLDRLIKELPSILNWALDGYERLRERGFMLQPECGAEIMTTMEDLASPITAFLRDYCNVGPEHSVTAEKLFKQWCEWCKEQGREHPGDVRFFGRDLRAAIPGFSRRQFRVGDGRREYRYEGVGLKLEQPNSESEQSDYLH